MPITNRTELIEAYRKFASKNYPRSVMTPDLVRRLVEPKCDEFIRTIAWLAKKDCVLVHVPPGSEKYNSINATIVSHNLLTQGED